MLSNVEGDRTDGGVPRYIFANLVQNSDAAQSTECAPEERQLAHSTASSSLGPQNDPGR